ncbi:lytic transglycosylase domain-containing protein [Kitasatospora sp. NPDC059811]|uniref:lytic transglycosylase domain-containing protein n=1 Tax=Kitasatospora sp. NPDC059811 TaxID=3346957 RepID=UPI003656889B
MTARFGKVQGGRGLRLGKRVTGTAAAFTALAALTGSQVTGFGLAPVAAADAVTAPDTAGSPAGGGPTAGAGSTFGTGLPADGGGTVQLPQPPGTVPGAPTAGPFAATGPALPATVLAAYRQAEASAAQRSPGCHLPWQLLAAIGQVESGQANGGQVDAAGTTLTPILGPALDGNGFAAIPDSDGGRYDGDARWDRAVGPMQFIPSTWATWGTDANGDGKADPNNIFDAAESAARYLCAGGRDLADPAQLDRAILSYNNSGEYLRTVRNWMAHYGSGTVTTVPNRPASSTPPASLPSPLLPLVPLLPPTGTTPGATTGTPSAPATTPTPGGQPSPSAQPTSPAPTQSSSAQPTTDPSTTPTGTPSSTPPSTAPAPAPGSAPGPSPSRCTRHRASMPCSSSTMNAKKAALSPSRAPATVPAPTVASPSLSTRTQRSRYSSRRVSDSNQTSFSTR